MFDYIASSMLAGRLATLLRVRPTLGWNPQMFVSAVIVKPGSWKVRIWRFLAQLKAQIRLVVGIEVDVKGRLRGGYIGRRSEFLWGHDDLSQMPAVVLHLCMAYFLRR